MSLFKRRITCPRCGTLFVPGKGDNAWLCQQCVFDINAVNGGPQHYTDETILEYGAALDAAWNGNNAPLHRFMNDRTRDIPSPTHGPVMNRTPSTLSTGRRQTR